MAERGGPLERSPSAPRVPSQSWAEDKLRFSQCGVVMFATFSLYVVGVFFAMLSVYVRYFPRWMSKSVGKGDK